VTVALLVSTSARAEPDPWFGSDKALHFGLSAGIAAGAYATSAVFLQTPRERLIYGASVAVLAGVGKELWDASGSGTPSFKDLTWDALGAIVGLAVTWAIDRLFFVGQLEPVQHESPLRSARESAPFSARVRSVHPERSRGMSLYRDR